MVRALLDGRKTQTRRVVKPQPVKNGYHEEKHFFRRIERFPADTWLLPTKKDRFLLAPDWHTRCPYGAPGDRLWVRETWMPDPPIDGSWSGDISWQDERRIDGVPAHYRKPEHCVFAASWDGPQLRWRPGIHMPRWASRLTLEVTEVRVERVQDISEEDAIAEGVEQADTGPLRWVRYRNYMHEREAQGIATSFASPRESFFSIWESINGAESWAANPWVWVVRFKVVGQ